MRKGNLNVHAFENRNCCSPKSDRCFFSNFDCQEDLSIGRILSEKKYGGKGLISEKTEALMQNLPKEWKQQPVVILQQAIFYNRFILCL